jgi:hypothetical protein
MMYTYTYSFHTHTHSLSLSLSHQVTTDTKATLDHIDEFQGSLQFTLSEFAPLDTRVGRGVNGIYQEPLERVLEYLGLSIQKNRVVFNATIDGPLPRRALIPGNAHAALYWYEQHETALESVAASKGGFKVESATVPLPVDQPQPTTHTHTHTQPSNTTPTNDDSKEQPAFSMGKKTQKKKKQKKKRR